MSHGTVVSTGYSEETALEVSGLRDWASPLYFTVVSSELFNNLFHIRNYTIYDM